MQKIAVVIPLWDRHVTILIGGCERDVLKFAQRERYSHEMMQEIKADTIDDGTRAAAWFCNKQGEGVMWFPKKRVPKSLLVHEATHIVDFLLMYIGATSEMEARAYTVEWLFMKLESVLK